MTGSSESRAYRVGVAVALVTSFLIVWTTVVRDDGSGIGYFMVILAAVVGGFSAWFRPSGMARTMLGVATMQALLGIAIATAPSTASMPDGSLKALLYNGFFTALWLISAASFRGGLQKITRQARHTRRLSLCTYSLMRSRSDKCRTKMRPDPTQCRVDSSRWPGPTGSRATRAGWR